VTILPPSANTRVSLASLAASVQRIAKAFRLSTMDDRR
jgi:hypothetical protein